LVKGKFLKKEHIKKESSVSTLDIVECDYNSEYSHPKSVPTIKIATQVKGVALPSTLADCGAMVNVISEEKVTKHAIPTLPMPPMKIREPVNPLRTCVDRKVTSKVTIPETNWESQRPAEFVVALLKEHDAIVGMPFFADEGILIDAAQRKVIFPESKPELEAETEFIAQEHQPEPSKDNRLPSI
jgi:hypothetical protein